MKTPQSNAAACDRSCGQPSDATLPDPIEGESDLLTYEEAAQFLNLPIDTLYWLVSERRVPHTRLGPRLVRFSRANLKDWLRAHSVDARSAQTPA
jgi:excisionase family DNA binding protein